MKKAITFILLFLCIASLTFVFSPKVFSQTNVLQIISYSQYTHSSTGYYIVVGEVQNVGPDIITSATIYGTMQSTSNATNSASNYLSKIYADHILPNSTAPFFMMFTPDSSSTEDLSWVSSGIDLTFNTYVSSKNNTLEDNYIRVAGDTSSVSSDKYIVTGYVLNQGFLYPQYIEVAATFYDSAGKVIGVGISDLAIQYLAPHNVSEFSVSPIYPKPELTSDIARYTLNVVMKGTTTQPTASPSVSPASPSASTGVSPNTSATPSQSSPSGNDSQLPLSTIIEIAVAIAAVVVMAIFTILLRRRNTRRDKQKGLLDYTSS